MRLAAALVLTLLAAPAAANQVSKAPIGTGGTVALDTGSVGGVATYGGNTATITVTTAAANEVIYCDAATAANSGYQTASISDTGFHTWKLPTGYQFTHTTNVTGYNAQTFDRFWALIPTAGSNTISISNAGIAADAVLANCYAFSGVLTTAPNDPNASLPTASADDASAFDTTRNFGADIVFSSANTVATDNSAQQDAYLTNSHASGKWVVSFKILSSASPHTMGVGFGNSSAQTSAGGAMGVDGTNDDFAFYGDGATAACNGVGLTASGVTFAVNDQIDEALDMGSALYWIRSTSVSNWNNSGTANPATGAGGISLSSMACPITNVFPGVHLNASGSPNDSIQTVTPPTISGFSPWSLGSGTTIPGISTSTSNDALSASFFSVNPSGGISTPCASQSSGTGFTTVTSLPFDGASGQWYCLWTEYKIVSGTLSSSTATLGSNWPHWLGLASGVVP